MTAPVTRAEGHLATIGFRAGIGGEPVLQEARASRVLDFQPAPWGAWITASAAHPVPGDHQALKAVVGVGCCAEIRSAGTTVARGEEDHRGWGGEPAASVLTVNATVASDAMLTWGPEPGLATQGCDHRCESVVQLAGSARLLWQDEYMVGRPDEGAAGTWRSRLRVTRDGWPVVSSELALGPGSPLWDSPAVMHGARAVSFLVVVDPGQPPEAWTAARTRAGTATGVALPLDAPGLQVVAWGDDLRDCRAAIASMLEAGGVPAWAARRWSGRRPFGRRGEGA